MKSKERFPWSILWLPALLLIAADCRGLEIIVPGGIVRAELPQGWTEQPITGPVAVARAPGSDVISAPRLSLAESAEDPSAAATSLRDGMTRVVSGGGILDDDSVPVGGRVWRRLRLRFSIGPIEFGQAVWIGSVNGRTTVVVLSAPDEQLGNSLSVAAGFISSLRTGP